jgi:hypothetical protein
MFLVPKFDFSGFADAAGSHTPTQADGRCTSDNWLLFLRDVATNANALGQTEDPGEFNFDFE